MLKGFACIVIASSLFASNTEPELVCNCLEPSQVHISEEGIYVVENEQLTQVTGVFSYGDTLFYAKFPSGEKPWMCPTCDYVNDKNAITCDGCNWDPRQEPVPFR